MVSGPFLHIIAGAGVTLLFAYMAAACEGECIVAVTEAWVGNYSTPILSVLTQVASEISTQLLPPVAQPSDPLVLVEPIIEAYGNKSYDSMEYAIFPSYFHGKCQQTYPNGTYADPPGCPDPDCPVVCGTPGSLVHFFSQLRFLAFNDTRELFKNLTEEDSVPFKAVQKLVEGRQNAVAEKRMTVRSAKFTSYTRDLSPRLSQLPRSFTSDNTSMGQFEHGMRPYPSSGSVSSRAVTSTAATLHNIFDSIPSMLADKCGGSVGNKSGSLPDCSWEAKMKKYILSFN